MKEAKMVETSRKEVFVGLDVHKKTYCLVAKTAEGTKRLTMPAEPSGLVKYLQRDFAGYRIHTAYEAGFCGFALHRYLKEHSIDNIVVNAASLPVASNDRVKTDKRDAKKLCDLLSVGGLRGITIPAVEQEKLRTLTRTRAQLVKERSRIGITIKSKLMHFGKLPFQDERVMGLRLLNEILTEWELGAELKVALEALAVIYRAAHMQIRVLEKEIFTRVKDQELYRLYRAVPGVGIISAASLMAELGDLSQFKSERAIFSFTGLTPSEFSSGEHIRRGHISRQGSARLRHILVEVAWRAIKKDASLGQTYERLKQTRGGKRAIVAVARRLSGRIRACVSKGQLYQTQKAA